MIRRHLGLLPVLLFISALGASPARAVTVHEILDLVAAGVSDEVIVALIEADDEPFDLDANQILDLRAAGVSDRVLVAMLRSGRRTAPLAPPEPAVHPQRAAWRTVVPGVVPTGRQAHWAHLRAAFVPVPVLVTPVPGSGVSASGLTGFGASAPVLTGFEVLPPRAPAAASQAPVFWGWGGTRRPDAWGAPRAPAPTTAPPGGPPR